MINIIKGFKNRLLNLSGQYRFYKSQYTLTNENSPIPKEIVEFETLLKQGCNNQILLKKIEELESLLKQEDNAQILLNKISELKAEIYSRNREFFRNKRGKKLADIRNNHPANFINNVSVGDFTYGILKLKVLMKMIS